jgi:hypothetical protein
MTSGAADTFMVESLRYVVVVVEEELCVYFCVAGDAGSFVGRGQGWWGERGGVGGGGCSSGASRTYLYGHDIIR